MNLTRMWAIFVSRNYEFFRDKAAFGWNFLFPFLIVAGFAIIFNGNNRSQFKAGIFPIPSAREFSVQGLKIPEKFKSTRYIDFIPFSSFPVALDKLKHHKIDILIKNTTKPWKYWINRSSPKGYIAGKVFRQACVPDNEINKKVVKEKIKGPQIRYIDWLFPGILGMNMMFSALYGVGYVIVRYRKNGVLKRLKATPLTAMEYLTAQMLSRLFLLLFTIAVVWFGCDMVFSFHMEGSFFDAGIVFTLGGISLVSMGLVIACRGVSEEFTSGIINFVSWPMMFLSGVWFSLEGSPLWVKKFAEIFPLTHMLSALRKIMNDGATLSDVMPDLMFLAIISLISMSIAAFFFSWTE